MGALWRPLSSFSSTQPQASAPDRYREFPGVLDLIEGLGEVVAPFRHLGRSHVHPTI